MRRRRAQRGHLHLHAQWHLLATASLALVWVALRPSLPWVAWIGVYAGLFLLAMFVLWPICHEVEFRLGRWWARRRQR